jgi:hypothetical protein
MTTKQKYSTLDDNVKVAMGRKNLLINGDFSVWQRGISQNSSGYGSDDRWVNAVSGTTQSVSRISHLVGQTAVSDNPKYFSRTAVSSVSGANNAALKIQNIEGVDKTSLKTLTVSWWAKADAPKNMSVEFRQDFGTGGSPTVPKLGVKKVALTSSWQKFTASANMPSVEGKTLSSSNDHFAIVAFWFDAGSTFDENTDSLGHQSGNFDISNVQLEFGEVATEFEDVNEADQLARCRRYFTPFPRGILATAYRADGIVVFVPHSLRIRPATSIETAPVRWDNITASVFKESSSTPILYLDDPANSGGSTFVIRGFSGLTIGETLLLQYTNSYFLDAEL